MKPQPRREPLVRSGDAPEWMDEGDDRVTCGSCGHRSRDRCIVKKSWAHLPNLRHWCGDWTSQGRK